MPSLEGSETFLKTKQKSKANSTSKLNEVSICQSAIQRPISPLTLNAFPSQSLDNETETELFNYQF